jgi:hypothetical protein
MRHPIPAEYEPILQRLHAALSDDEVRHARLAQEELLYEFTTREKALEEAIIREQKAKVREQEAKSVTITAILNLQNKGMSLAEITSIFNLTEEEIKKMNQ